MDMSKQREILSRASCEIRFDGLARQLYASDASIYQIEPLGVCFPKNAAEASEVVRLAGDAGVSIVPRGAGTGLAGGAVGSGLVVDMARHTRQIQDLDKETGTVRVGPGVVLDQLNAVLAFHGRTFGPDVATSSRATMGGIIANNSSGARAPLYGTASDHVVSLDVVLADGSLAALSANDDAQSTLRAEIDRILEPHAAEIERRFAPDLVKRWPGYALDDYLRSGRNLAQLFSGSEGTLGLICSAKVNTVALPNEKGLALFFFASISEAMQATVEFLDLEPAAIEHIDRVLFDQTRSQHAFAATRALLELDEKPCEAILIVEFYGEVEEKLTAIKSKPVGLRAMTTRDPREMTMIWDLRKSGLSLLTGCKGPAKPIAGIEDVAVRPAQLPDYVSGLQDIMGRLGLEASYYGHAASGLLHVRPVVDLHNEDDIARYRKLSDETAALTKQFHGSFAAEHGVGIARTEYLPGQIGPQLTGLMRDIKRAFDPAERLNPGKIVRLNGSPNYRIDEDLRWGADYTIELPFDPVLAFREKDASFVGNLEQCNGCGGCRKDAPTMCPTFLATGDEIMSTRGRANTIRAAMDHRFEGDPVLSDELLEAVSNCLACKACTAECPSNVNMTLLKAELLHARHQRTGLTLRERLVSHFDDMARIASLTPRLANFVNSLPPVRRFMDRVVGLTERRPFPKFAARRFDVWFAHRKPKTTGERGAVCLWDDPTVRYCEPEVGIAAVQVLEAAGYEVKILYKRKCDGRPAFSVGRLDMAKRLGEHNVRLFNSTSNDEPLIFLEPSSYSMFVQDYLELGVEGAEEVARRCVLFDPFIEHLLEADPRALHFREDIAPAAVHAHCHAKSIDDPQAAVRLINLIPGGKAHYLDTGCCGMAGQFGQLKEKYDLSVQVAQPLVEKIRALEPGTALIASGTSCRNQAAHLTEAQPEHTAQYLARHLA